MVISWDFMEILLDLTVRAIERGPVEIVDFPNKNGDVPSFCESLPEGISTLSGWWFQPVLKIWKPVGIIIPNMWKIIKAMFQTTNQLWWFSGFLWWFNL